VIEYLDRSAGPFSILVVRGKPSNDEILIPFAKDYLRRVDVKAKRVEMALPEGLVDLNQPKSSDQS
jgi:16S rRNA processing protein RimM